MCHIFFYIIFFEKDLTPENLLLRINKLLIIIKWSFMHSMLERQKTQSKFNKIEVEFEKTLTPEKCQNYINHLKKVIKIVIEKEGGWSYHYD
ncbi:hypothetical protein BpHYR1_042221 [Brachionus plicatilis]|uniref:Uncharacterized protein n=1 Tax=Brachionus plicatilis TaxID=10195 RepID=A0A3M7P3E2_BRAPC|nr:hypothetical protein BpHYR1_042221 [Brachionus plicatilis]